MALTLQQKQEIVAGVRTQAEKSLSFVAAEYGGLTVAKMTKMRNKARENGIFLKVIKNSLARKAFEGTDFSTANTRLKGQLIYLIGGESPGMAARLAKDFAKEHEQFRVHVLAVGSNVYSPESIDAVAALPTKDEALSKLLSCMQAPIAKFVRTLAEPQAKLVRTIAAIKDTKI